MVPLPHQCPCVSGKVCIRILSPKDNDPHRLCTSCRGKRCSISDCCEVAMIGVMKSTVVTY